MRRNPPRSGRYAIGDYRLDPRWIYAYAASVDRLASRGMSPEDAIEKANVPSWVYEELSDATRVGRPPGWRPKGRGRVAYAGTPASDQWAYKRFLDIRSRVLDYLIARQHTNPIDWSGYASTAADYARKGADAARRGYKAAVPHVTRAARATGRATVAAAKATARGARKAAKATARTAAPTLRGWMDRAEKWGRSNPSGPDPLLTDLAVMPIGHSTTRADRVITRWRDGYELDTWNRGPVRSLAETVAILRSDPRWARKNKPRR